MSSEKVLSAETRPSPADDNNESECKGNSGSSHDSVTGSKPKVKLPVVTDEEWIELRLFRLFKKNPTIH